MTDPQTIASKLTRAQRAVFLRGLHGTYTIATLHALKRKGLIRNFGARPGGENAWPDTPLGEQVRTHLEKESKK